MLSDLGLEMEVQPEQGLECGKEHCVEEGIREDKVAVGLTKHVDRSKLEKYMKDCGFTFRDGRHELCPHLGDV